MCVLMLINASFLLLFSFFMLVIPVLTILQLKPIMAMLLTGPYLGYFLTNNIHEQPAIWCYTAIGQILLTFYLIKFK